MSEDMRRYVNIINMFMSKQAYWFLATKKLCLCYKMASKDGKSWAMAPT